MKKLWLLLLISSLVITFNSCKKEDPQYPFKIIVVREDGLVLPNVYVEATADVPDAIPEFSGLTDENGEVEFEYDYDAVLKVRATRGSNPPTWMGCNFVKLEADKTVTIKVTLQPYDPTQPGC